MARCCNHRCHKQGQTGSQHLSLLLFLSFSLCVAQNDLPLWARLRAAGQLLASIYQCWAYPEYCLSFWQEANQTKKEDKWEQGRKKETKGNKVKKQWNFSCQPLQSGEQTHIKWMQKKSGMKNSESHYLWDLSCSDILSTLCMQSSPPPKHLCTRTHTHTEFICTSSPHPNPPTLIICLPSILSPLLTTLLFCHLNSPVFKLVLSQPLSLITSMVSFPAVTVLMHKARFTWCILIWIPLLMASEDAMPQFVHYRLWKKCFIKYLLQMWFFFFSDLSHVFPLSLVML